jgi:hypothetical protein
MPLPGRDKTFAFENCRSMLDKLKREIDRYTRSSARQQESCLIMALASKAKSFRGSHAQRVTPQPDPSPIILTWREESRFAPSLVPFASAAWQR